MDHLLTIDAQFRGPPDSGNGGFVAGAIAERLLSLAANASPQAADNAIEVTLRAPTPLGQAMSVVPAADAHALRILQGDTLIAEARRTSLTLNIPTPPSFADALAVRDQSPSFLKDINPLLPGGIGFHPICFCCGADVEPTAGLHVYAAPVPGFDGVAAAWHPNAAYANADGLLNESVLWAALDCPGQFAYFAKGTRTGLLGRMTGRALKPVIAEQNFVVIGWCIEVERSKHFAGTALFDASGELCAYSKQVWIGRRD